jgi:hypothetical protein
VFNGVNGRHPVSSKYLYHLMYRMEQMVLMDSIMPDIWWPELPPVLQNTS